METCYCNRSAYRNALVLTVPMRNGNYRPSFRIKPLRLVLTVPMRNGNCFSRFFIVFFAVCSYRTYEEWKLCWICLATCSIPCSYRTYEEWKLNYQVPYGVPSDGSYRTYEEWKLSKTSRTSKGALPFLPYLWGMETCISQHARITMARFLPYLWGMETLLQLLPLSPLPLVLTVPMRNGNLLPFFHHQQQETSSYRTYEEWKRPFLNELVDDIQGSYRTYEEWKLPFPGFSTFLCQIVLTVPMRNGNWSERNLSSKILFVLTVPMRNGNSPLIRILEKRNWFLPYLWGMETKVK